MGWINDIKVSFKILILAVIAAVALLSVGYTGPIWSRKCGLDTESRKSRTFLTLFFSFVAEFSYFLSRSSGN